MEIKLNKKIIEQTCGKVSYKSGDAFYRANKVKVESVTSKVCVATVVGTEDFHVIIKKDLSENFHATCSCPKLASITKDCQHVAAVLIAIHDQQSLQHANNLTNGLVEIFQESTPRPSGQQVHFESREVVDTKFILKPIDIVEEGNLFAVELVINSVKVEDIRTFLKDVNEGIPSKLSSSLMFNLNDHCFEKETDNVIQEFFKLMKDERVYFDKDKRNSAGAISNSQLVITPNYWRELLPLLIKAPLVAVKYEQTTYPKIQLTEERLPIHFELVETEDKLYHLKVSGMKDILLLFTYNDVFFNGKIAQLEPQQCKQLSEVNRMLVGLNTDKIPISQQQLHFFLEKVIPGLRALGEVTITAGIQNKISDAPLMAKLYLDRVQNRLLAGLEFHYGNIVINPLENSNETLNTVFIRDTDKEAKILRLMEDSLFATTDSGYVLYNEELEYDFLYNKLPEMQQLAQVYTTTAIRNRIVKANSFPKIRVKFKRERTNWLEFKFEMDGIRDDDIRDLLEALEEKRKYYRLKDGGLLALDTREFEEINRFLQGLPEGKSGDLEDGLTMPIEKYMEVLDSVESSKTFLVESSFKNFLKDIEKQGTMKFAIPESLAPILREYQIEGYQWLKTLAEYGFGGILADDMGLGKTVQSITYILSELTNIREVQKPVLIVCPSSLIYNWLNELAKFTPEINATVIAGNKNQRSKQKKTVQQIDVVITSYPILRQDINYFEKEKYHTVFFDEAQAFKNPITQTARAVKRIKADHKFALTGTPVENSIEELWAIFHVVFPDLFLGLKQYSTLSRKMIARRASPFLLRRLKTDVLKELPDKKESIESVELLSEQKQLYAAYLAKLKHDTLKHLDKETFRKNKIQILAGLTRLRQICCHPSLFIDNYSGTSAKFEQLMDIIKEAKLSGRRVLIFSQFTKMLELIGKELTKKDLSFFYLDGQTPAEDRMKICDSFNAGARDLFLISMKAGGQGLNLTGADTVIFFDSWWNPAVEEQAADRAYRIGQKSDVQVIKLVAKGTVEEKMLELQDKKRHLIGELMDPEEEVTSTITEEDIKDILMI
ncbi:helicase SNF [Paraliobacillus quinghaiensis]|uniref:Helicase SNF n=1 Tax=Paraliobacillus quinghaiensis TaxID=470815 RepID=A0A917WS70_9BACI|nr:DEAD/DEAH box helicase [Paraliobacillus quinghaiensis]GGM24111.1 helicase SNF [Paraliobacillus quinghaiensis]